jgi:hypothetical protein
MKKDNGTLAWEIRDYVEVTRKPYDTDDVYSKTQLSDIPDNIQEVLKQLPVLEREDYFEFDNQGFFGMVLDGDQQIYLMKDEDRIFFIDTQGYEYARYIGEIIGGIELLK